MVMILTVLLLLLFGSSASALTISQGSIWMPMEDTFGEIAGDEFRVHVHIQFSQMPDTRTPSTTTIQFAGDFNASTVESRFGSCNDPFADCGFLRLITQAGSVAPFVAFGHLNVGPGIDIQGQGTMQVFDTCGFDSACIRWTFHNSVQEPASVALLGLSLIGLALYGTAKKM